MTTITSNAIIEQLNSIKAKVEKTKDNDVIRGQINLLERIASRFFEDTSYTEYIEDADESNEEMIQANGREVMGNTLKNIKNLIFIVIDNMTAELQTFGLPSSHDPKFDKSGKSITIQNNHTISQSQSLNIEVFREVLKDSLTGKQYKELVEITKEEKDISNATPKIIDKLKSFGSDVASNIVANLLTNPHLYTAFF